MKKKGKRQQINDSEIMDALDASNGHVGRAASKLGVTNGTLSKWILESENLKKYQSMRRSQDAIKARDKLNDIMDTLEHEDPRFTGHVIKVCQILLDKAEADKHEVNQTNINKMDEELAKKIDQLIGDVD